MQTNQIAFQISQLLSLEEDNTSRLQTLLLCCVAYAFGAGVRLFYLFNALENPVMLLDGVPMISTEDGYLFANYSKEVINDFWSYAIEHFGRDKGHGLLIFFTWLGYHLTPFTIEQVAVFMPPIFPPLVVIPIIYLGRVLGNTRFGFFAALITVVGITYLRRTSFAYYDTDFFSLTFPCLLVLMGVYTILNPSLRMIVFLSLYTSLSPWLDKVQVMGSLHLAVIAFYSFRNFRRESFPEELLLLLSALEPSLKLYYYKFLVVVGVTALVLLLKPYYSRIDRKWLLGLVIIYGVYVLLWDNPLFRSIRYYITYFGQAGRGVSDGSGKLEGGWKYYQVSGTVAEARLIGLEQVTKETLGYTWMFIFGLLGACLSLLRYPMLAVGGVLLGVGIFSLQGGIRFIVYLIPVLSIGAAFLILLFQRYVHQYVPEKYFSRYFSWFLACIILAVFLYPGVSFSYGHQPRFVAHPVQVRALQKLEERGKPEDYIISWWDYGYVMSFYSGMRNIINGGKHNQDNYIVSKAFSSTSQSLAANLLRESVEIYETRNEPHYLATQLLFTRRGPGFSPSAFVRSMGAGDYSLERQKTRDIYLYLPYQMIPIYRVVRYFSDLSLETGRLRRPSLIIGNFYRVDREKNSIFLSHSMTADLNTGELRQRGQVIGKINTVYTHTVKEGKSVMESYPVSGIGNFFLILSPYYRSAMVMGPEVFNSNYIQMFFFNKYDPEYFELLDRTPLATVYKLKI